MSAMSLDRRTLLRATLAGVAALAAGLWRPLAALAANWPHAAFNARSEAEALQALFGRREAALSRSVRLELPRQSDGTTVPVTVRTDLPDVEAIVIMTRNHSHPLNTFVRLSGAAGIYSSRIRVHRTSPVTAYVKAAGRIHSASAIIKINIGGYGMGI